MSRLPDFIIIGAMKCATSTLHEQLARQPGLYMSDPKEPCFFSGDEAYARGIASYASLFTAARAGGLCGESSTHYTKLPTYPRTVERMRRHMPHVKLIYVMRHPIDRLVSHYIHEWSERTAPDSIETAVRECPRLTDYGCYAKQLRPYLDAYGPDCILPVFSERLRARSQGEFERICRFIGYEEAPHWHSERDGRNASAGRLRDNALRDAIVWNRGVTWLRRRFVPQSLRDRVKRVWQMKNRPQLSNATRARLVLAFDQDLKTLGRWFGVELNCENFTQVVTDEPLGFDGLLWKSQASA